MIFKGDDQNHLDDDFGNDGQQQNFSPNKGKYYDNLSNYQLSVRKYLEESAVNLPYEDRKSVRLSVMSHKEDMENTSYLHPNRNRASVNKREEYERQMQLSTLGKSNRKSVRREQLSVMSESRGGPRGLSRFNTVKDDLEREEQSQSNRSNVPQNNRSNLPPMNINIGNLGEVSFKGSQCGSKFEQSSNNEYSNASEEDKKAETIKIEEEKSHTNNNEKGNDRSKLKVTSEETEGRDVTEDQSKEDNIKETGSKVKTISKEGELKNDDTKSKL